MNLRTEPHAAANEQSTRVKADRMRHRPKSLLRWLQDGYLADAPAKLHSGAVLEEDGDPAMTGEAKALLGFTRPREDDKPTDWRDIACQKDPDGYYRWPMRAAIARLRDPWRRRFVAELATELFDPLSVAEANLIPAWCADDVINASLELVWKTWRDAPLPQRSRPSESQSIAESAA